MNISINLLPPEVKIEELKKAKFYKIQFLGIAAILLMVFLSTLTFSLGVLQSRSIASAQNLVSEKEKEISDYKTTQGSLFLLRNRLDAINKLGTAKSKQQQAYQNISDKISSSMTVSNLNINSSGNVVISAVLSDLQFLEEFVEGLLMEEDTRFSEVAVSSLSGGRDKVYRVSLEVKPK